jgi:GMP synthase (glutamine-hydrolysing)
LTIPGDSSPEAEVLSGEARPPTRPASRCLGAAAHRIVTHLRARAQDAIMDTRSRTGETVNPMRAVIYQHDTHEDLGLLGPALTAAGFSLVKRFRAVNHQEDVSAELVVILGGSMSVAQSKSHPFLHDEEAVLLERLAADRPCFGLCLGAQLLAHAAGADVFKGKNGEEIGIAPVRWTKAGQVDPALLGVGARSIVAHWHADTFTAVPGATLLASTDRYTQQAFRVGRSLAFQFHPELTAEAFGRWLDLGSEQLATAHVERSVLASQLPKLKAAEAENAELLARVAFHFARSV